MFFAEVLGFWVLVGMAFFGWRHRANNNGFRILRALPPASRWGSQLQRNHTDLR